MTAGELEMAPRRGLQVYYPWLVIGIAFLTVAVAFGLSNAFAVFLIAVTEEFHWSRGLASGALMVGAVVWTAVAPVIGMLLDRYGPRPVLAGGALIMALGFVVSGLARSAAVYYLGRGGLVGIGFAALPVTSQATFLSNWFVRKRGMAIGLAASGIGPWLGGAVFDWTGSYRAAFWVAQGLTLLSVGFIWLAGARRYRQHFS